MKNTVNTIFDKLVPHIPANLITSEVVGKIRNLNDYFPAGLSTTGGFECRLGTVDRQVDWFLGINALHRGRDILADKISGKKIPDFLKNEPTWQAIREFALRWADPKSPVHKNVYFLWLEFDYPTLEEGKPIPGVFLLAKDPSVDSPVKKYEYYDWLHDKILKYLHVDEVKKETADNIRFCLKELPDAAGINYVALMLGRKVKALRLILSIPRSNLESYLERIKWNGSIPELMALYDSVSQFVDTVDFNLDIADRVLPKIGLECILLKKQLKIEPRWKLLTENLVERGLCLPDKGRELLSWPGYEYTTLSDESEPSYVFRGISHIKMVYQTGKPLEVKGYLGFRGIRKSEVEKIVG